MEYARTGNHISFYSCLKNKYQYLTKPSRFGSLVAHPDLDDMGRSQVRVRVIPKTLIMVLSAPQPVLVIMSLSKGNALALKMRSSYLTQWIYRQSWYNSKSWLSDKMKRYKNYGPLSVMMSAHSNHILSLSLKV